MSESTAGTPETDDRTARLEEEGEIAADYLEELLDIADLDGDIDLDIRFGRAAVEVLSEDGGDELDRLVGRDGEVLDALQELTRLAVQVKTGERSRLMLDVAGYRAARRAELTKLGESAVAEVRETGRRVALEPLNAFERKVVHDVVAAAGLVSDSEGEEPRRYVVIHPATEDVHGTEGQHVPDQDATGGRVRTPEAAE
ncbi:single-stranded DNA-binding protein [Myceligenerans salitolerans]|uniref:Single-stranded DNA-binding protein n=1 Tax=Myceligenerans salitolerans TaxID=1230528 RepID=A0ABS3I5F8_9MICO|nr:R3H domain-containing nucleic acid-binding protein [Myceligenerans salitolerans]MBO0608245.1 single-stranded DNA-binding protein [Myceligenerans salitolerans]